MNWKMKQILTILLAVGVGFAVAALWFSRRPATNPILETSATTVSEPAPTEPRSTAEQRRIQRAATAATATEETPLTATKRSAEELLNELASIQVTSGPGQARAQYRILALLDQLAQSGSSALPAIRQFLTANRDVSYSIGNNGRNGGRNGMLPPSLRMGLFDVVRQIGGPEAELALNETLSATGRAAELTYLAQLLDELAPGKYRDVTLTAARNLLTSGKITDADERNNLYDLLVQLKDTSFVTTAQANLVQADGKVDASALRYLQRTLGEKSVALAAQLFQDQRVVDADSREALGRLALNYVGANEEALALFHKAALDPQLKPGQRRNLIEDLNQDGLSSGRNPTSEDLKLIANRYALTQSYLQQDYVKNDKTLLAAFLEANQDLSRMLERAGTTRR